MKTTALKNLKRKLEMNTVKIDDIIVKPSKKASLLKYIQYQNFKLTQFSVRELYFNKMSPKHIALLAKIDTKRLRLTPITRETKMKKEHLKIKSKLLRIMKGGE